jgi:hypothetical protein
MAKARKAAGEGKEDIRCGFTQDYRMDRDKIARVLACGSARKHTPVEELEWDESTDRTADAKTYTFDGNYKLFNLEDDY